MNPQKSRDRQLRSLTNEIGVYALCDLDNIPIYIGQSVDGIRTRVRRHLTSARSDIIANRQLDVWEIAYVWAWPMPGTAKEQITAVEHYLINLYHAQSPLMNGSIPNNVNTVDNLPEMQSVQILDDKEIETRKNPNYRLPRQAEQFTALFGHILEVKNNPEQRRTLKAHFDRLKKYYEGFMNENGEQP